jgi:hypothetical protein
MWDPTFVPVVRPTRPVKQRAGGAVLPITKTQPVDVVASANVTVPTKRALNSEDPLAHHDKRQWLTSPTSSWGRSADPSDGPILLSDAQVTELGECVRRDVCLLQDLGWEEFIRQRHGRSDLSSQVNTIQYPARSHLRHLRRHGSCVPMSTPPWTAAQLAKTLARGPHKSAVDYAEFLGQELVEFVLKGQWVVLPYQVVQSLPCRVRRQLRISPMGGVPQQERRPRVIVDYSFSNVNQDTVKLAPRVAMQFGKALERILRHVVEANPVHGPVYLIKIDISDGFYRIWLNSSNIPTLAVSLPPLHGNKTLIALPLVLPMGWTESPPYFTVATETVADLANQCLRNYWHPPPHRLEQQAHCRPTVPLLPSGASPTAIAVNLPMILPNRYHLSKPVANVDVFVDNFIAMCQGSTQQQQLVRRVLLHSLDNILCSLEPGDNPHRSEPASTKKLAQGDEYWETRKTVLGWVLDMVAMTIKLPAHCRDHLQAILASIPSTQKRRSVRKWQQILGELRSMAIAIPGSHGLFSRMQETLKHRSDNCIRLSQGIHDCLADFRFLDQDLTNRPTRLYEIVAQDEPDVLGATNACGLSPCPMP